MKLYYEPAATTCRPVMLFAAEHGIDLDYRHVQLFEGEHLTPAYAAINPNKAVPVLLDGELRLTECSAILKYLADLGPSAAYPSEIGRRAEINAAMDWFNTGFYRDFGYGLVYPQVLPHYANPPGADQELLAIAEARSRNWLDILDHYIADRGGPYLMGGEISLVDYLGACYTNLGELIAYDFTPWRHVRNWLSAMQARPGWDEVHAAFYGWSSAVRAQAAA